MHDDRLAREILYEFTAVGDVVRVSAVDAGSGVEVTVFGPATAGESALRQTARRKLDWVMAKRDKATASSVPRGLRV